MKNWWCSWLVLLGVICCSSSLLSKAQVPHIRFHVLDNDFQDVRVRKLLQDKKGFLWLGTSQGLFRFDGQVYDQFLLPDSLADNSVSALYEDQKGIIWVGYNNGQIARWQNYQLLPLRLNKTKSTAAIQDFLVQENGDLWFATYGEGLYCLKNKKLHHFSQKNGLKDNYTYSLAQDAEGAVWVGTDGGIAVISQKNGKFSVLTITTRQGLPDNMVTALATDANQAIWIGTQSKGVCRYHPKNKKFEQFNLPGSSDWGTVNSIKFTGKTAWIATNEAGVIQLEKEQVALKKHLHKNNSSVYSKVTDLLPDREGNVWLAGNSNSIAAVGNRFSALPKVADPEIYQNIHALLYSRRGALWFGSDAGLFKQILPGDGGKNLIHITLGDESKPVQVVSLYQDAQEYIWAGTFGNGVYRIHPETGVVKHITEKHGLINNNVLSISGKANEVWFATLGGVSKTELTDVALTGSQVFAFTNYSGQSGLGINYIYKVFADSKGRLWFATDGKGVTKLENGRFTNFSKKEGLSCKVIYSITEDAAGNIWMSSRNQGLFCFDGKGFKQVNSRQGLRDLSVTSVAGDKAGNVLMVHKRGIDVFNPVTGQINYYGTEAGVTAPDADLNAVCTDQNGRIWIGTQNGILCYEMPDSKQQQSPVAQIKQVQLFLDNYTGAASPAFAYDQNHISFDYVGLWYQNPEEVSYQVKLEGYDSDWTSSKNHFITYPNLPPGTYTFRLKASDTKRFAGAAETSYQFTIQPPFWNTTWFYLLTVCMFGAGLYSFVKQREGKLKKAERFEKEKAMFQFEMLKSQVNPHFLFNSFNTLISIIEDDQDAAVNYVEKLSDFYRDILLYREKDVIPLQKELELIENYYFLQQKRYGHNLSLQVNIAEAEKQFYIAPLTLQLLVENAVKHNVVSRDKPLQVRIYTEAGEKLVVENNLQPKKTQQPSTGTGLQNIRRRYRILSKKDIEVSKTADTFMVQIPLLKEDGQ
ncbi:MAG: histidine kinase [Hymenobacteraceae bacterium]|nr:histidine kinase [Hymenobacteraceae bacterium]